MWLMQESSYNAPRLHVAIEARKIVISGEVAGLQIQLGPPAVRAGSTPVIFRQFNHFYPCELIQKISLSVQYLSLLARFSPVL